jgi:hypothetical protein
MLRWWRAPIWILALATGAKSFADNPILGSRRLNRFGLHVTRKRLAHWLADRRRARLAHRIPPELREQFDCNGYVVVPNVLPDEDFQRLRADLLARPLECRAHQQGDTITRRVPVGPSFLRQFPSLARLIADPQWKSLMAYVASFRSEPLYYIQTVVGGMVEGDPDPQLDLHADTFHPSLKAWLFLTDVPDDGRPLTYVAGSHKLTPSRARWERRKSINVLSRGDRLSQRGSFRVAPHELERLGLPQPTRFCVPANTLVVADTCGFHSRAESNRPTCRVELWAYSRRSPFLPWASAGLLSLRPIAARQAQWAALIVDLLDRLGWMKQHWRRAGERLPTDL